MHSKLELQVFAWLYRHANDRIYILFYVKNTLSSLSSPKPVGIWHSTLWYVVGLKGVGKVRKWGRSRTWLFTSDHKKRLKPFQGTLRFSIVCLH